MSKSFNRINTVKKTGYIAGILFLLCSCMTCERGNNGNIKNIADKQERMAGEYLVKISPGTDINEIEKIFKPYGIAKITPAGERLYKIKLNNDPGPEIIKEIAAKSESIEYAEPNYIYRANPSSFKDKQYHND